MLFFFIIKNRFFSTKNKYIIWNFVIINISDCILYWFFLIIKKTAQLWIKRKIELYVCIYFFDIKKGKVIYLQFRLLGLTTLAEENLYN